MEFFTKKIGTVFLKEISDAESFIDKMETLKVQASGELKELLEKEIKLAKYGLIGEQTVAYELKNSGIDMYILHDIYLEFDDLSAQIDYLVITRKHIYVIECKNLFGNIEIDHSGNFIRSYELSGKRIKEGIYSPITQNQRHMRVLKELRKNTKQNLLSKFLFEKDFENTYKSIIVLANPKTYLNAKYAKKEVKDQVIRADQLVSYINKVDASNNSYDFNANTMLALAQFFLDNSQPSKSDYSKRYEDLLKETTLSNVTDFDGLTKELKSFRLQQSRAQNIKPYYIFNDAQMNDLIQKFPCTKEDLLHVAGFGAVKVEKYGDTILEILAKYR